MKMKETIRKKSNLNQIEVLKEKGITLIALVVTIIILLILAGVAIASITGENGLFKKSDETTDIYKESQAREALEILLSANATLEKVSNTKYNQNDFLDDLIINAIKGANVTGDIVIIDGYAFELDRNVPEISRGLGKESNLDLPKVTIGEPEYTNNNTSAKIKISVKEETKGIDRIEIWFNGENVETIKCEGKTIVEEEYVVKINGTYTIKAYSDLSAGAKITVNGIIQGVDFFPNGSDELKREHSTRITVKEEYEKIIRMKYLWAEGLEEPKEGDFIEECINNSTITGNGFTGIYRLWILMETESGKKSIFGSNGFNFDNEGPTISVESTPVSDTSFMVTATVNDNKTGILKYEIYLNNQLIDTKDATVEPFRYTINVPKAGTYNYSITVYDLLENSNSATDKGTTMRYYWSIWNAVPVYSVIGKSTGETKNMRISTNNINAFSLDTYRPSIDEETR